MLIKKVPVGIKAASAVEILIRNFFGCLPKNKDRSTVRIVIPDGWSRPGQTPEIDDCSLVLDGQLHLESRSAIEVIQAGQAVMTSKGKWARFYTPEDRGVEYTFICPFACSSDGVCSDDH
ncbi:hypothetical protein [Hoeflea sp. TYP-13]|uniref:hypothetical protein n=1 Tax=Hoeflea sp. TYP-13 TaxID=3230023 RepID=UPI0034C689DC